MATLKSISKGIYNFPGNAVTAVGNFIFGNAKIQLNEESSRFSRLRRLGLVGSVLAAVEYLSTSISSFLSNHQTAITRGFWIGLATAAAVAITGTVLAFVYPGLVAAAATYTILGLSIATIAGTNVAAQIAVASAVAFAAANAATYAVATVYNAISSIVSFISEKFAPSSNVDLEEAPEEALVQGSSLSARPELKAQATSPRKEAEAPVQTPSVFAPAVNSNEDTLELDGKALATGIYPNAATFPN